MSKQQDNVVTLLEKLSEKLDMLETNEKVLIEEAGVEAERGRKLYGAKNKRAAMRCFQRKRYYDQKIEQLGNLQIRIHDQMILLEFGEASLEPVDALIHGTTATKTSRKATNINDFHKTLDEINEQVESMKLDHLLSEPLTCVCGQCGFPDSDEDEFDIKFKEKSGEIKKLEGAEEDELAALHAEFVLEVEGR